MSSRWFSALFSLLALALFGYGLVRTVRQLARAPEHNWDMLPAMALALEWEEKDPVELHRRTYALAREELPPEVFAQLTAPGVRAARAQDPAAFHEHLAFYRGRVLYSMGVRMLHRQGAALSDATWLIPLGCYALVAVLVLAWATVHLPLGLAALFALGVAHTPALLNQANTSSADGLALLFVCLGAWALVERRLFFVAAGMLTCAVAARPDTVILIGALAVALLLALPRDERPAVPAVLVWILASAALYLGLARFAGEYGWWPLIQISFVEKAVHPSALPTAVDWNEYLGILGRQLAALPGDGYVTTPSGEVTGSTAALAYAGIACAALPAAWKQERRVAALFLALGAAYLARFLLFPQLWDRFFAALYVLVPVGLVSVLGAARTQAPPRAPLGRARRTVTPEQPAAERPAADPG